MINFLVSPKKIDFARNELGFKIIGTNYIETQGTRAVFIIQIMSAIVNGDKYLFYDYDANDWKIVACDNSLSADSGFLIRENATIDQLVEDFNSIHFLAKHFNITKEGIDLIKFEAKEIIDILWLTDFFYSANIHEYSYTQGIAQVTKKNYKILTIINIDGIDLPEISIYPDSTGTANLLLKDFLSGAFSKIDLPFLNFTCKICQNLLKPYIVKFAEVYEIQNPYIYDYQFSEVRKLYTTETLYVLNAKANFINYQQVNLTSNQFLTERTKTNIWADDWAWLYFLSIQNHENVKIKFTLYYTDNTQEEITKSLMSFNSYSVYCVAAGLKQYSIYPVKEVYKYKVVLQNDININIVNSPFTYYIKLKPINARMFIFQNIYGVFESLICNGEQTTKLKTERSIYKKSAGLNYDVDDGEFTTKINSSYEEMEVATAYELKSEIQIIKRMLTNSFFYYFDDIINQFVKCEIINTDTEICKEDENLSSLKIQYRFSFDI